MKYILEQIIANNVDNKQSKKLKRFPSHNSYGTSQFISKMQLTLTIEIFVLTLDNEIANGCSDIAGHRVETVMANLTRLNPLHLTISLSDNNGPFVVRFTFRI